MWSQTCAHTTSDSLIGLVTFRDCRRPGVNDFFRVGEANEGERDEYIDAEADESGTDGVADEDGDDNDDDDKVVVEEEEKDKDARGEDMADAEEPCST